MADQMITALTPHTTPVAEDELVIVADTTTIPVTKKITYSDLIKNSLPNVVPGGAGEVLTSDGSAWVTSPPVIPIARSWLLC
jgi:hypothetical protein